MCPRRLFDLERRVVVLAGYFVVGVCLLMADCVVNCDSVVNEGMSGEEARGSRTSVMDVIPSALNGEAIQLAIAWDGQGSGGRKVDISVRTKKVKVACPSITCLKLGIDADQNLLNLPEHYHYMEEPRECDFYPGCTYSVILKYEDSAEAIQQDVIIPDCVENICRCDYQEDFPDFSVKLNYEETAEVLHFHWDMKAPEGKAELKYFVVRYYKVHNRKTVTNLGDTFEPNFVLLNESLTGDPWTGLADLQLSRASFDVNDDDVDRIKVEVFLSDSKECHSKSSIEYLELTPTEKSAVSDSHWIPTSLIIVGVITSLAVAVVYYSKSKLKRHIIAKLCRWPINYSNININSSMTRTSISLQENVLYVEKELYEAKITGKVDSYEVSPSCLTIGREIGKGAFGRVFIAIANNLDGKGGPVTVAVKKLKRRPTEEEADDFFKEIQTMKRVGYHENIISLLGCCTMRQPVLMIMEYVGNGDLQHYLQALYDRFEGGGQQPKAVDATKTRTMETESDTESECSIDSDASYILANEKPLRPSVTETLYTTVSSQHGGSREHQTEQTVLNHEELQEFAIQIANGMSHLEDLDITHRDLATRNILIDHQKRLKISDFGLSRDGVYVTTKSKRVPLRWLSIEAIRRSLYSSKSDVWAFGVVLWEIGTLGRFPYQGVDNSAVLPFLLDGGRLAKPDNCSDKLYQVMLNCWAENPLQRPSFFDLLRILQEPEQKIYIDLDELGDNDVFMEAPAIAPVNNGTEAGEGRELPK